MTFNPAFLLLSLGAFLLSCTTNEQYEQYKKDLLSNDTSKIGKACYELGEARDTSAIKLLLTNALDPRISHNMRFYGMSVNQCRLAALKKISGISVRKGSYRPDTAATLLYLDWAIHQGYLANRGEVDIYYHELNL